MGQGPVPVEVRSNYLLKANIGSRREKEVNNSANRRGDVGGVEDEVPVEANVDLRRPAHQLSHTVYKARLLTFMVPLPLGGADGVGGAAVLTGAGGGPP